jgi:hypothetical protein
MRAPNYLQAIGLDALNVLATVSLAEETEVRERMLASEHPDTLTSP